MDKLLIAVITLALGAAFMTAGAYYGNQAYQDAKAEAYAQQILSNGATAANAWRQWSKDNGGITALTDNNWQDGTATELVPNYLAALPKMPSILVSSVCSYFIPINFTNWNWNSSCVSTVPVDSLSYYMTSKGKRICEKIAETSRGKGASLVTIPSFPNNINSYMTGNKTFDCMYYSPTNSYFFVYRVFQ